MPKYFFLLGAMTIMFILLVTLLPHQHWQAETANTLMITEIMPNPTGTDTDYEWVELTNFSSSSLNLKDYNFLSITLPDYSLLPGARVILVHNINLVLTKYGQANLLVVSYSLNNSGADLTLENKLSGAVQHFVYSSTSEEKSWELLSGDCGQIKENTSSHTYNQTNTSCTAPTAPITPTSIISVTPTLIPVQQTGKLFIKQVEPDPVDNQEKLQIQNVDNIAINIFNWSITDKSGKSYKITLDQLIQPEEMITIIPSSISLNNDGDNLYLIDPDGHLTDIFVYGAGKSGVVFQINADPSVTTVVTGTPGVINNSTVITNNNNKQETTKTFSPELAPLKIYRLGHYPELTPEQ
ncbi:MAG: lamin tail domain-containing protein [bacterium]